MPIHDFHCKACDAHFEKLVRADTLPVCPHCGAAEPERVLSRVAPAGTSKALIAAGRRAAAREGHFSNYSAADKSKLRR
jgi:putative FmdB family regulatory protein